MKFLRLLLYAIALMQLSCSRHFVVKEISVGEQQMEILKPPGTKFPSMWKKYKTNSYKQFQAIFITGLNKNYGTCVKAVSQAKYEAYWNPINHQIPIGYARIAEFTGEYGSLTIGVKRISKSSGSIEILEAADVEPAIHRDTVVHFQQNLKQKLEVLPKITTELWDKANIDVTSVQPQTTYEYTIKLQINYDHVFTSKANEPKKDAETILAKFDSISNGLLKTLAYVETLNFWASGTGQHILTQTFSILPIPQMKSLNRYAYQHDDRSARAFLDSTIIVQADTAIRVNDNSGNWINAWLGLRYFVYSRSASGYAIQNTFAPPSGATQPPNSINDYGLYNVASFSDIQNSSHLSNRPYVMIYRPIVRRNSSHSNPNPYSNDETDPLWGNSMLVHFLDAELSRFDFQSPTMPDDSLFKYTRSVFSPRGDAQPMFVVFINNHPYLQPFNTTPSRLSQIPRNYKVVRKYRDTYRKVKGEKNNLILITNDHIKY